MEAYKPPRPWRRPGGVALNPLEVDDMAHAVAWIFEVLLRLWLPLSGRHRAAEAADDGSAGGWHESRSRARLVRASHWMVVVR
ncbi:hypothetical protein GCM10009579_71200 [Streptomyces javensis]|uniref:Transposase n=2 Tax=Streptomyces javensis TaxID=114698 RepID=A0ABN1XD62_9ACTN